MVSAEPRLSDYRPPPNALAVHQNTALAQPSNLWADPDWQRFWLTLDRLPWKVLSLIPAGEGGPADFTLSMAVMLSRTGMTHIGAPIQVADGTQIPLNQLNPFLAEVRACTEGGQRVIVALAPTASNATTTAIAKASDGVVLCVLMERMLSRDAQKTLDAVGASRFLGSVMIHPSGVGSVPPPPVAAR
jgi:hypothetical protein